MSTNKTSEAPEQIRKLLNEALAAYVALWMNDEADLPMMKKEVRQNALEIQKYVESLEAQNTRMRAWIEECDCDHVPECDHCQILSTLPSR